MTARKSLFACLLALALVAAFAASYGSDDGSAQPTGKGGAPGSTATSDGSVVDSHAMPKSLPIAVSWAEYFNVGVDTGTSVDDQDYQVPFPFAGKLEKLTVKLGSD